MKAVGRIKMRRLERPKILVIGELNVDIVATGLRSVPEMGTEILAEDCELTLGSASAIFAAGMAKLGHHVTFVSHVGRAYAGLGRAADARPSMKSEDVVSAEPAAADEATV